MHDPSDMERCDKKEPHRAFADETPRETSKRRAVNPDASANKKRLWLGRHSLGWRPNLSDHVRFDSTTAWPLSSN